MYEPCKNSLRLNGHYCYYKLYKLFILYRQRADLLTVFLKIMMNHVGAVASNDTLQRHVSQYTGYRKA